MKVRRDILIAALVGLFIALGAHVGPGTATHPHSTGKAPARTAASTSSRHRSAVRHAIGHTANRQPGTLHAAS